MTMGTEWQVAGKAAAGPHSGPAGMTGSQVCKVLALKLQLENMVQKKKHCAHSELCPKSNLANWSFSLPLSALCARVCIHVCMPTHVHVH